MSGSPTTSAGCRYRAGQPPAALDAGMGNVLKIVRFDAVSEQRGRDRSDLHPVAAMRAREEETGQAR